MSSLITHIERWEVAAFEAVFEQEPQCESERHTTPDEHNHHEGNATHYQVGPCPHANGLRCAPHVANVSKFGAWCPDCDLYVEPEDIRFVEL